MDREYREYGADCEEKHQCYSRRNYSPELYTFETMLKRGIQNLRLKDLVMNVTGAKMSCLTQAGKEDDMTMTAIERDGEYLPQFKKCIKNMMTLHFGQRVQYNKNLSKVASYHIPDGQEEAIYDMALDQVKLNELHEVDWHLYVDFRDALKKKTYGKEKVEVQEEQE